MTETPQFNLDFTRAYAKPLCSGRIRKQYADFQVIEIPSYEITGAGEHCLLNVRKTGANTEWVAKQIARFAGVKNNDVGFAGRKDRQAITTQWFSCWLPGQADPDWSEFDVDGVEILATNRHDRKLKKGALKSNRFILVISDLDYSECGQAELVQKLEKIKVGGVPNYFGEQRFGHSGRNLQMADRLFNREIRVRDRQKKGLYLSAARSYMFNLSLAEKVRDGSWCQRKESGGSSIGSLFGKGEFDSPVESKIEKDMPQWCNALINLGMKRSYRALMMEPDNLEWQFLSSDRIKLQFELPRGCYATSLLRELVCFEEQGSSDGV